MLFLGFVSIVSSEPPIKTSMLIYEYLELLVAPTYHKHLNESKRLETLTVYNLELKCLLKPFDTFYSSKSIGRGHIQRTQGQYLQIFIALCKNLEFFKTKCRY